MRRDHPSIDVLVALGGFVAAPALAQSSSSTVYWDGAQTTANSAIDGGTGTWNSTATNWTSVDGTVNTPWPAGIAIFKGPAGTVTLGDNVAFGGLQFLTTGYAIDGGPGNFTLAAAPAAVIRVDTGLAGMIGAGIVNGAGGPAALTKDDAGTLILTGNNSYTGGTLISSGTLQIGNGGATGEVTGSVVNNGTLVYYRSDGDLTLHNSVSGNGVVRLRGTGVTNQSGYKAIAQNTAFSGLVVVENGARLILEGGNSAAQAAGVVVESGGGVFLSDNAKYVGDFSVAGEGWHENAGRLGAMRLGGGALVTGTITLTDDAHIGIRNATATVDSLIGDLGQARKLEKIDSGTLIFTGNSTYTGGTTISGGTLQIGNGGTTGNVAGAIVNNATLVYFRSDADVTLGNSISGTGAVRFQGTGVSNESGYRANVRSVTFGAPVVVEDGARLTLEGGGSTKLVGGVSVEPGGGLYLHDGTTYTGPVSIAGQGWLERAGRLGALRLGNRAVASGPVTLTDDARMDTLTATGTISGAIGDLGQGFNLEKSGSGTLIFTGENTYTGGTTISRGTLQIGSGGISGSIVGDVIDNAALVFDRSDDITYSGKISGNGNLTKSGRGALALTGANSYRGGTSIDGGSLRVATDGALGDAGGALSFTGGTLQLAHAFDLGSSRAITLGSDGGAIDTNGFDSTLTQAIGGSGALTKSGAGTLTLAGDNIHTGGTIISAGTLKLGNGGTTGGIVGNVIDNAALIFDRSDDITYAGTIFGDGSLTKSGSGTLILAGANLFGGGTTIAAGTLQLGNGGTTGSVAGDIVDNSALIFNRRSNVAHAGIISGTGTVTKVGDNALVLAGSSTYTGTTTVTAGSLVVNGSLATASAFVGAGARLAGRGQINGHVTIADGAHLAPGAGVGTLAAGSLALAAGSQLDFEYVSADSPGGARNDRITVAGNLTLDGTLNVIDVGGFGDGVYTLASYGGSLIDNGLAFGALPAGFNAIDLTVQTAAPGQVNLVVSVGGRLNQFWDGAQTTGDSAIAGGGGAWTLSQSNWTNAAGTVNALWEPGFAVFMGAPGTVTLGADVPVGGMQFRTDGYAVIPGASDRLLAGPSTIIRVDPDVSATVRASLVDGAAGAATLTKTDEGTLALSGKNTYSGGTRVAGGTLRIGADTNLGAATGTLTLDGGRLQTTASFTSARGAALAGGGGIFSTDANTTLTLSGAITGPGSLTKSGGGTLFLSGANSYRGGTSIEGGTLRATTDSALGDPSGALAFNGGTLQLAGTINLSSIRPVTLESAGGTIDSNGFDFRVAQEIVGDGALTKSGAGTLTLADNNTYTGGTTITAGTLQIGYGGPAGRVSGDIVDNGALVFNQSEDATHDGTISGTGTLTKFDGNTLTLTADSSYTGGTTISGGTLQIGNGSTSGSIAGNVTDNAALIFNRSGSLTYAGIISGTGSVTKAGTGVLTLTGSSTYTGGTIITAGTLQLGAGNSAGDVIGDIVDNGALVFNRNDDIVHAGMISGTGTLTKIGGNTLALTADNAYSGGTTISDGTLQIGNGGVTGSIAGDIHDNAVLAFNRSDDVVYAGRIDGSGSMIKDASNTLTLTGNSTYAGTTTINSGRLLVNGTIASAVNVGTSGTLGGTGSTGSTINAGHVAPGASIGTLSISGDFVQQADGALDIEFDDQGGIDLLAVGGAASVAGAVNYLPDPGSTFTHNKLYTFLVTGTGLSGEFVTSPLELAGVRFETVYNADSVQLAIISRELPDNMTDGNLANCLESIEGTRGAAVGDAALTVGTLVQLPVVALVDAAVDSCPRDSTALAQVMQLQGETHQRTIQGRIAQIREVQAGDAPFFDAYRLREGAELWMQGTHQDGKANARSAVRRGYDTSSFGFVLGFDTGLGDAGAVGGYLAYDEVRLDYRGLTDDIGDATSEGWTLGIYGSHWTPQRWYFQGSAEYSWLNTDSTRAIDFASVSRTAHGDRDANGFLASFGAGYNLVPSQLFLFQPEIIASYSRWDESAYSEWGADSLDLSYRAFHASTARFKAGFTARTYLGDLERSAAALYGYLHYVADFALDDRVLTANFAGGAAFDTRDNLPTQDGIRYGIGLSSTGHNDSALYLNFDAQDMAGRWNFTSTAGFRLRF